MTPQPKKKNFLHSYLKGEENVIIVNNYKNEIIGLQIYVLLIKISVAHPNEVNIF